MDFIHYKKSLIPLAYLFLQGLHIKQEELIGHKLILFFLQGIRLLFNKDSSTVISLRYFHYHML
jgi:hypothetical protein